jgi:hypothetical protein
MGQALTGCPAYWAAGQLSRKPAVIVAATVTALNGVKPTAEGKNGARPP